MKCWICEQENEDLPARPAHDGCLEELEHGKEAIIARIREEAAREAKPVKSLGQVACEGFAWIPGDPIQDGGVIQWARSAAAVAAVRLQPPEGKTLGEVLYSALGGWSIPDQNVMANYDGAAKRFIAALGPQEATK